MEFEYIQVTRNYGDDVNFVNIMAEDSWELVNVVNDRVSFIYWFRRKKQNNGEFTVKFK